MYVKLQLILVFAFCSNKYQKVPKSTKKYQKSTKNVTMSSKNYKNGRKEQP